MELKINLYWLTSLMRFDLFGFLGARYKSISNSDKLIYVGLFALGVFTFFFFVSHALMHNHGLRLPWIPAGDHMTSGRWFAPILAHFHYNANVPILLPLLGIVMAIVTAETVLKSWKFELSPTAKFLVLATIVTFPMVLSHYYYTFMTALFFVAWVFAAMALYAAGTFKVHRILLGAVFVLLLMASYQSSISILVTTAVAAAIAELLRRVDEEDQMAVAKSVAITASARVIATVIGGGLYVISLKILDIDPPRTIEYLSWHEIPERVFQLITVSIQHLFVTTQPEFLTPLKVTLSVIVVAAVLTTLFQARRSIPALIGTLALWPIMIIATKTIFFVVAQDSSLYEYRYNGSIGFVYAFSLAILLLYFNRNVIGSIVRVATLFVVFSFVQADMLRQLVLLRGQQHDLAFANRVLTRIESLPELDTSQRYNLIRVGHMSYYREHLFKSQGHNYDQRGDGHMDVGEISDQWVDEHVMRLLGSRINFTGPRSGFYAEHQRVREELLEGREPWPHPSSVFIHEDEIIVYMME